ncbi:MAG TPA: hypothetical protein ENH23_02635 [candidate division Zixibacteria bacterium]|nr:hypothetical protein [candidate division Zixibacteria bacterium]
MSGIKQNQQVSEVPPNKALHLTAIPLRFIAAGERVTGVPTATLLKRNRRWVMRSTTCEKCKEIIEGKTSAKHSNLERSGLAQSVGYHGSRDDEYYYVCKNCGTRFIGDSCGIWLDRKS